MTYNSLNSIRIARLIGLRLSLGPSVAPDRGLRNKYIFVDSESSQQNNCDTVSIVGVHRLHTVPAYRQVAHTVICHHSTTKKFVLL